MTVKYSFAVYFINFIFKFIAIEKCIITFEYLFMF